MNMKLSITIFATLAASAVTAATADSAVMEEKKNLRHHLDAAAVAASASQRFLPFTGGTPPLLCFLYLLRC